MTDHSQMRLGKHPRRRDARTLKMARYVTDALPPAPAAVDYTQGVGDFGVMLNDSLGCCTIAAVAHAIQVWKLNAAGSAQDACPPSPAPVASALAAIPDSAILEYYEKWDGYNPADPTTDQGGVELDVLNDWRQQGFAGHALDAFVAIDQGSGGYTAAGGSRAAAAATAIWLFGGAYIGVELPLAAQTQEVWDVTPEAVGAADDASAPGSWGGHAVYLVGYDRGLARAEDRGPREQPPSGLPMANGQAARNGQSKIDPGQSTLTCVTWGQTKKMTWAWFEKYCSEAYALVSADWLDERAISPSGFDLATLERDLVLVTASARQARA